MASSEPVGAPTSSRRAHQGPLAQRLTQPASARRVTASLITVATVVAALLRLQRLSVPGYLYGPIGYDEGVYFGDALRVVHGQLPYRDFIAVHPPGIMVLLAPLAKLTDSIGTDRGFALARIATALTGAAAVAVIGLIVRHRGPVVTGLACLLVAVHPGSIAGADGVFLEPWLVLFCLLGIWAAFEGEQLGAPRRLFVSGVLFGVAGAIKVWAIGPVLVLALLCLRRRAHLTRLVAGTSIGFLVLSLPFAVLSVNQFVHEVISVQLSRDGVRTGVGFRLNYLLGVEWLKPPVWIAAVATLAVAGLVVAGTVLTRRYGRLSSLERFSLISVVVTGFMMIAPTLFLGHYATFWVPFAALALALSGTREVPAASEAVGTTRRLHTVRSAVVATLALAVVATGGLQVGEVAAVRPVAVSAARELQPLIPAGACVLTNDPSATIAAGRFVSTDPRCPPVVDTFGTAIDLNQGAAHGTDSVRMKRFWANNLQKAQFVLFEGTVIVHSWGAGLTAYLHRNFRLIRRFTLVQQFYLYRRRSVVRA